MSADDKFPDLLRLGKEMGLDPGQLEAALERAAKSTLPENVTVEDFYAYLPDHKYIFTPTRELWPAPSVDARIPKVEKLDASEWLDARRRVEQMTWVPGEPMVIANRLIALRTSIRELAREGRWPFLCSNGHAITHWQPWYASVSLRTVNGDGL